MTERSESISSSSVAQPPPAEADPESSSVSSELKVRVVMAASGTHIKIPIQAHHTGDELKKRIASEGSIQMKSQILFTSDGIRIRSTKTPLNDAEYGLFEPLTNRLKKKDMGLVVWVFDREFIKDPSQTALEMIRAADFEGLSDYAEILGEMKKQQKVDASDIDVGLSDTHHTSDDQLISAMGAEPRIEHGSLSVDQLMLLEQSESESVRRLVEMRHKLSDHAALASYHCTWAEKRYHASKRCLSQIDNQKKSLNVLFKHLFRMSEQMDVKMAGLHDDWNEKGNRLDDLLLHFEDYLMRLGDISLHPSLQSTTTNIRSAVKGSSPKKKRSTLLDCVPERQLREWYVKCQSVKEDYMRRMLQTSQKHQSLKDRMKQEKTRVSQIPIDIKDLRKKHLDSCKQHWMKLRKINKRFDLDLKSAESILYEMVKSNQNKNMIVTEQKTSETDDPSSSSLTSSPLSSKMDEYDKMVESHLIKVTKLCEIHNEKDYLKKMNEESLNTLQCLSEMCKTQATMVNYFADGLNEIAEIQNALFRDVVSLINNVLPQFQDKLVTHYFKSLTMIADMPQSYNFALLEIMIRESFQTVVCGKVQMIRKTLNQVFEKELNRRKKFLSDHGSNLPSDFIPGLNFPMDCIEMRYISSSDGKRTSLPRINECQRILYQQQRMNDEEKGREETNDEMMKLEELMGILNGEITQELAIGIGATNNRESDKNKKYHSTDDGSLGGSMSIMINDDFLASDFAIKKERMEMEHKKELEDLKEDYEYKLHELRKLISQMESDKSSLSFRLKKLEDSKKGEVSCLDALPSAPPVLSSTIMGMSRATSDDSSGHSSTNMNGMMNPNLVSSMIVSRLIDSTDPNVLNRASMFLSQVFTEETGSLSGLPDAPSESMDESTTLMDSTTASVSSSQTKNKFDLLTKQASEIIELRNECKRMKTLLLSKDETISECQMAMESHMEEMQKYHQLKVDDHQKSEQILALKTKVNELESKLKSSLDNRDELNRQLMNLTSLNESLAEELKTKNLMVLSLDESRDKLLHELQEMTEKQIVNDSLLDSHLDDTRQLVQTQEDLKLFKLSRVCISAVSVDDLLLFCRADCLIQGGFHRCEQYGLYSRKRERGRSRDDSDSSSAMSTGMSRMKAPVYSYFALCQSDIPYVLNDSAIPSDSPINLMGHAPCFLSGQVVLFDDLTLSEEQYGLPKGTQIRLVTASSLTVL